MTSVRRLVVAGLAMTTTLTALSACDAPGSDPDADTVVESVDLTGVRITVGSKSFTEQEILAALTIEVLQAAGATVVDRTGLGSTAATREALDTGAIDMYWEYTGTGWVTILGHENAVPDADRLFRSLAREDLRTNDIAWVGPPAPANNTYAIAVSQEVADPDSDAYDEAVADVQSLSELGVLVERDPEAAELCVAAEFARRKDGLQGMQRTYGFVLPDGAVRTVEDEDVIYEAVDNGDPCTFGEVFRTDGRIDSLGLDLLDDDKGFFPVYNPALTVRAPLLDDHPEIESLFAPIAAELDETTLRQLSADVVVTGRPARDVARDFLDDEGFLSPQQLTK